MGEKTTPIIPFEDIASGEAEVFMYGLR